MADRHKEAPFQIRLSSEDKECIDLILSEHKEMTRIDAVRYALYEASKPIRTHRTHMENIRKFTQKQ